MQISSDSQNENGDEEAIEVFVKNTIQLYGIIVDYIHTQTVMQKILLKQHLNTFSII